MSSVPFVVLAEDNPADVYLVRTALQDEGLEVNLQVFSDGEQLLTYINDVDVKKAPQPDLLLLDLNMPKRSGHEILARLKEGDRRASPPVIVITSSDSIQDKRLAAEMGAAHFFCKPSDLDEFMKLGTIVRSVLTRRPV